MTQSNVAPKGGLEGVTAADSAICMIDGSTGELRYCGYLISDLAEHCDFVETIYLLWYGELPTSAEHAKLAKPKGGDQRGIAAAHETPDHGFFPRQRIRFRVGLAAKQDDPPTRQVSTQRSGWESSNLASACDRLRNALE